MSSEENEQTKQVEEPERAVLVDKERLVQGIRVLTSLYQEAIEIYEEVTEDYGKKHTATEYAYEKVRVLGGLVDHFSNLTILDEQQLKAPKTLN